MGIPSSCKKTKQGEGVCTFNTLYPGIAYSEPGTCWTNYECPNGIPKQKTENFEFTDKSIGYADGIKWRCCRDVECKKLSDEINGYHTWNFDTGECVQNQKNICPIGTSSCMLECPQNKVYGCMKQTPEF